MHDAPIVPRPSRWTICSPICNASAPRWRLSSTSTGEWWASSRSRTSSRRSSARSPMRPTRPPVRYAGWLTATCSCAGTSRSPTYSTTESTCRSTATPTTRSAASCSPSSADCPGAGDTISRRRLLDQGRVGPPQSHRGRAHPERRRRPVAHRERESPRGPDLRADGPEYTSGPRGGGPERVHWEEAGVRCDCVAALRVSAPR